MCLYAWRKIRLYFAQIRSYVDPHVKETHIKIQPLTAISGYVGNVNTRFLRAVYVCICPGQSKTVLLWKQLKIEILLTSQFCVYIHSRYYFLYKYTCTCTWPYLSEYYIYTYIIIHTVSYCTISSDPGRHHGE